MISSADRRGRPAERPGPPGPVSSPVGGADGLARFGLEVLRPLKPMLAQSAETPEEALARVGPAVVEWKLDGARLQVHRLGAEVRAFTRNLADVTEQRPPLFPCGDDFLLTGVVPIGVDWAPSAPIRIGFASRTAVMPFRSEVPDILFHVTLGAGFTWIFDADDASR